MAISSDVLDEERKGKLKELLKEAYPRLEEMYLGSPALTREEQIFFVDKLIEIDPFYYEDEIRRALKTNQGITRTMEEFAGRTDDKTLRNRLRSAVLLKAAVIQLGLGKRASSSKDFELRGCMKSLLRQRNQQKVEAHCNESVTALKASLTELNAGGDRILQEALNAKIRAQIPAAVAAFNKLNSVGSDVVAEKARAAAIDLRTNLLARKADKFIQFQASWNQQAGQLEGLGELIGEVNDTFMEAVKKDDAQFAAAREFKANCVKNLFAAVQENAPPPFNLIGTAGVGLCKGVELTIAGAAAGAGMIKRNSANPDVVKAIELAEKAFAQAEKRFWQDHGTETQIAASNEISVTKIRIAQAQAAKRFYDALKEAVTDSATEGFRNAANRLELPGARDFDNTHRRDYMRNDVFNKTRIVGSLKYELERRYDTIFKKNVADETERIEDVLQGLRLPVLAVNDLGNDKLLKRCLYLYLTGLYIREKIENNKNKFFKLQTNMCKLLESEDVKFLNQGDERDDSGKLGMSLPYVFGMNWVRHDSRLVRVNAILLRYAQSDEMNPFAVMLNPRKTAASVSEYFDQQDTDISAEINKAKALSDDSAKRANYHEIERSAEKSTPNLLTSGPLRPDGSF